MFETERLIIRAIEDSDFNVIKRGLNRQDFLRTSAHQPLIPLTDDEVKELVTGRKAGDLPYYAVCKKTDEPAEELQPAIGTIGFQNEHFDFKNRVCALGIGFFNPEDRGKGYGGEVMRWAIQYGFDELNLHKLSLVCYSNNEAGAALYRKVGFIEEGRLRKTYWMTGKWYDTLCFGLLHEEWLAGRSKLQEAEQHQSPEVAVGALSEATDELKLAQHIKLPDEEAVAQD